MTPQEPQPAERRAYLPLAYDVERLVATLLAPRISLNTRLAAAERLYTLMPTYIRRMLFEAAVKIAGKEALTARIRRKEAEDERLYSLMPTYIRRMLFEAAIKLAGKEALTGEGERPRIRRRGPRSSGTR